MTATGTAVSVGLNSGWLDTSSPTITNASYPAGDWVSSTTLGWWPYPQTYYYPWYVPCYHPEAKPIKLKMSEIESLRGAARRYPDIKEILAKFTDLIEVTVDFE